MPEQPLHPQIVYQAAVNTRAIELAAGAVEVVKHQKEILDEIKRRQEKHEDECGRERKEARHAREKMREDILSQQNQHHSENKQSISKLHERFDESKTEKIRIVLALCGACVLLLVGIVGLALQRALGW